MRGKKKKRPGEKYCDGIIKDAAFPVCIGWWGFRERERENLCVERERIIQCIKERERMYVLRWRKTV